MGFDFLITKYHDSVAKFADLIKKMAALTGGFESVAVGGFSQGGQVAIDAALASQTEAVGSLMVLASSAFDNQQSITQTTHLRNRSNMRFRHIVGVRDVWFPAEPSSIQLKKVIDNYDLNVVGRYPDVIDGNHCLFLHQSNADYIYNLIRTEINAIKDTKAEAAELATKYNVNCCSSTWLLDCSKHAQCITDLPAECADFAATRKCVEN